MYAKRLNYSYFLNHLLVDNNAAYNNFMQCLPAISEEGVSVMLHEKIMGNPS